MMNQEKADGDEQQPLLGANKEKPAEKEAEASAKSKPPPKTINYAFMDGLRGLGSFAVYLSHMRD